MQHRDTQANGQETSFDACSAINSQLKLFQEEAEGHMNAISEFLRQIVEHTDAVRKIKSRMNDTVSPISRLPPEVLRQIFLQYAALHSVAKRTTACKSITHVCRSWRILALDCSMLWTFVYLSSDDSFGEIVTRSKHQPLFVAGSLNSPKRIRHLMGIMPKVTTLQLFDIDGCLGGQQIEAAPLLETLELAGSELVHPNATVFSDILYNSAAPRLRQLRMFNIAFEWRPSFVHPNLTNLRLQCPKGRDEPHSLSNILDALSSMPLLETLHLEHCLPREIPILGSEDRKITLSHLHSIELAADTISCANLLSYLDCPVEVSINVQGKVKDFHLDALHFGLAKFTSRAPQCLKITENVTAFEWTPAETPEVVQDFHTQMSKPSIIVREPLAIRTHTDIPIMALSHPEVVALDISIPHLPSRAADEFSCILVSSLRRMPKVKLLRVDDLYPIDSFVEALSEAQFGGSNQSLMPELHELEFGHAVFKKPGLEKLHDYLQRRLALGFGLQKLSFLMPWCQDDVSDILSRLREIVPTVVWSIA